MLRERKHVSFGLLVIGLTFTGCSPINRQNTRDYSSLYRKPLDRWSANDVIQASRNEKDDDSTLLESVSLDGVKDTVKRISGQGSKPEVARTRYLEAETLFREASSAAAQADLEQRRAKFLDAGERYQESAKLWPESELEQDALFMAGESYFFADRYPNANDHFEQLLEKYPNTKHLDRVEARRFRIAQFWLQVDNQDPQAFYEVNLTDHSRPWRDQFGHAVRIFNRIRFDDPTGRLADDATLAAGMAYLARGDHARADEFFTDLRKTFASSEHQFIAHLRGIETKLRSYQGPDYSSEPLLEAEKLIKQVRKQFPLQARQESEYLTRVYAEARFRLAERDWLLARFYERRGQNAAARLHYDSILDDYADTSFAGQARE